jgi:hypothetical protein
MFSSLHAMTLFLRPNIHAASAPEIVKVIVLQIMSAKAPAVVKLFVVPSKPKSTDARKRMPKTKDGFIPSTNVLAPDHLMIVVTKNQTAIEESTIAHTISWSSFL